MDDFIRREVAIQKIRDTDYDVVHRDGDNGFSFLTVVRVLHEVPAADVAPLVHGKWKRIDYKPYGHDYVCSACNQLSGRARHYCPDCGAKMGL